MNTNGLEQEFLQAYEQYADAMFRYCLVRVRNREQALDLTQEVFLKTWKYLVQGNTVRDMRPFLYEVARNLIINESVRRTASSLDALMEAGFEPESTEHEQMQSAALFKDALGILETLDGKYREPVLMRYVDGLGVKEIAKLLGENENTISVRIFRGLEQARNKMNNNHG